MREVTIRVDASKERGSLKRIWRSFGYDEINWTYTNIGKYIFSQIKALRDGPYWIRNHNAFTSGNRISKPAWGSTNCYTEDSSGRASYDWSCNDRVYDVFLENGCKPMIELDFMPHDLSSQHVVGPEESWRYPPKDYERWRELSFKFAEHLIDRYGKEEVRSWYFSTWNEADIKYFKYKPNENLEDPQQKKIRDEEFFKVHDFAADGIWAADDCLRLGGPDLAYDVGFLDRFLEHCHNGVNYATGKKGCRLDFISVHAKGTRMSDARRVNNPDYDDIAGRRFLKYWDVITKYDRFKDLPIIGNEWDIDVGTVYGTFDSPDFEYRNNSYYPVFIIRCVKDLLDLIDWKGVNIELITTWSYYFHGRRCFEGFRALFDPFGIRKPIFNAFEMLSQLGSVRVHAVSDDEETDIVPGQVVGYDRRVPRNDKEAITIQKFDRVKSHPTFDTLAAKEGDAIQLLVWHQLSDQYAIGERSVRIEVKGLKGWKNIRITHYRISENCSNAYSTWKRLGRPDWPDEVQVKLIKNKEKLEKSQPDRLETVSNGNLSWHCVLPMHSVSLFVMSKQ
jgi:xylan 1,4-beta-xylosidase